MQVPIARKIAMTHAWDEYEFEEGKQDKQLKIAMSKFERIQDY